MGLGVVMAIVVSGFVASLSRLAGLAGLDSKVDFSGWLDLFMKLSRYHIVPVILAVMVTRFLKVIQLVLLNLSSSENVGSP